MWTSKFVHSIFEHRWYKSRPHVYGLVFYHTISIISAVSPVGLVFTPDPKMMVSRIACDDITCAISPHGSIDNLLEQVGNSWTQSPDSGVECASRYSTLLTIFCFICVDRMTGVGGRPEVIIEGRQGPTGEWKEYHFLYKPGDVSARLTVVGE